MTEKLTKEEILEKRREEAATTIQNYVRSALKLCKSEDDITLCLFYFGIQLGKALKEITPEEMRERLRRIQ